MKTVCSALGCVCLVLSALAGCGSSSPPLSLTCTTQRLPGGLIRARVTVTNNTDKALGAFVYGPPLSGTRHIYPALTPGEVSVTVNTLSRVYIAFAVPRIDPKRPAHLILRLAPPARPQDVTVTTSARVAGSDWHVLDNKDCVIKRR